MRQATPPSLGRRRSSRAAKQINYAQEGEATDGEPEVFDDKHDRDASPDQGSLSDSSLSDAPSEDSILRSAATTPAKKASSTPKKKTALKSNGNTSNVKEEAEVERLDEDGEVIPKTPTKADKHRARDALAAERYANFEERPPPIDSDYVPVPWKGRLGYACLNTILRSRKAPVFCSRTTRIATIQKEDHGMPFLLELGRQNAADLSKMLLWNEQYGIRFFRVSSEMFPFASHEDYVYNLEHADKELREAGAIANKYDHRITCHPGQFTQIASPNPKVFVNAVRDLELHDELLTRLRLDEQRDRDAVMILHLGGMYGDKEATLERFRTNYAKLSDSIKRRLVLENDDMSWSVTDLLPLCQELNIPLVLDWHHHNVVHDEKFREGTLDIMPLLPAIAETWTRKGIKQKMHTSEAKLPNHPLASQRRSHSHRIYHLPPCADDMDLMLEAKDKEQAVFELSKTYNLNNPPVPEEVVGDGPGAKGDEAYWPEGQEIRLKVTKTRVKKEPEYDSDGKEIKPTPKKRVKKEPEYDSDGNEIKPTPKKRAKKEPQYDSEGNEVKPAPKKRANTKAAVDGDNEEPESTSKKRIKAEDQEESIQAAGSTPASLTKKAKRSARAKEEANEEQTERSPLKRMTKSRRGKNTVAASKTELETGLSAGQLVDDAVDRLRARGTQQA
jgi:UV DNA damage endonuclease